jgi:phytanoyl-CoA hydroxylase
MIVNFSHYTEHGFVLCKGLFAAEEIARIHAEAKKIFAMQMLRHGLLPLGDVSEADFNAGMFRFFEFDLPAFMNCGKQAQHLISLHRLSLGDRIVAVLKEVGLPFPNIGMRPLLSFHHRRLAQKEAFWRLPLHQDWRTTQGSLDSVVVWVPLVDVDKHLGALEIVPGSHRWGLLAGGRVDSDDYIAPEIAPSSVLSVEMERGDALLFSTLLAHRSGNNVTESIRWSCSFRYNNLLEKTFIQRAYPHPFTYNPQKDLITACFPTVAEVNDIFNNLESNEE